MALLGKKSIQAAQKHVKPLIAGYRIIHHILKVPCANSSSWNLWSIRSRLRLLVLHCSIWLLIYRNHVELRISYYHSEVFAWRRRLQGLQSGLKVHGSSTVEPIPVKSSCAIAVSVQTVPSGCTSVAVGRILRPPSVPSYYIMPVLSSLKLLFASRRTDLEYHTFVISSYQ